MLKRTIIAVIFLSLISCGITENLFSDENKKDKGSVEDTTFIPDIIPVEQYKLNPFDLIEVSVFQEPDLSKTVRVSQDGYISFPLIGKVKVSGLDIISAETKIAILLEKDYLVNPSVTVLVKEFNIKKIFVLGEVKNPGSFAIPQDRGLTVLEAVSLAGGFSKTAAANSLKVIRVENGLKKNIEVKVNDITKHGDKSKDIKLMPNDIVFVPESIF